MTTVVIQNDEVYTDTLVSVLKDDVKEYWDKYSSLIKLLGGEDYLLHAKMSGIKIEYGIPDLNDSGKCVIVDGLTINGDKINKIAFAGNLAIAICLIGAIKDGVVENEEDVHSYLNGCRTYYMDVLDALLSGTEIPKDWDLDEIYFVHIAAVGENNNYMLLNGTISRTTFNDTVTVSKDKTITIGSGSVAVMTVHENIPKENFYNKDMSLYTRDESIDIKDWFEKAEALDYFTNKEIRQC